AVIHLDCAELGQHDVLRRTRDCPGRRHLLLLIVEAGLRHEHTRDGRPDHGGQYQRDHHLDQREAGTQHRVRLHHQHGPVRGLHSAALDRRNVSVSVGTPSRAASSRMRTSRAFDWPVVRRSMQTVYASPSGACVLRHPVWFGRLSYGTAVSQLTAWSISDCRVPWVRSSFDRCAVTNVIPASITSTAARRTIATTTSIMVKPARTETVCRGTVITVPSPG